MQSPFDYLRKCFRQRPGSGSSSIPNIIVESPVSIPILAHAPHSRGACHLHMYGDMQSELETTMSPATTASQPKLLSPKAANRPLPQDDVGQHQHQHRHHGSHSHLHSHSQSHSQPHHHHHHHQSSSYDTTQRSRTPHNSWPASFIPYPLPSTSSSPKLGPGPGRDHRHAQSTPAPNSNSNRNLDPDQSQNRHVRTESASTSMGWPGTTGGIYEAALLPPGVTYLVPPVPHTSHRRYGDRDGDRERVRVRVSDRERARDVVREWEPVRGKGEALKNQRELPSFNGVTMSLPASVQQWYRTPGSRKCNCAGEKVPWVGACDVTAMFVCEDEYQASSIVWLYGSRTH